jgi:hypothetical protein
MKSILITKSWRPARIAAVLFAAVSFASTAYADEVSVHIRGVGTNNVSTPLYFKSEGTVNQITMIKAGLSQAFYYRGDETLVFHDNPADFDDPLAVPVASVALPTDVSRVLLVGNQVGTTINIDTFDISSNDLEPGDYLFFNFSSVPLQFVYGGYPVNVGVGQMAVFLSGIPWRSGGSVALSLNVYRTDTNTLIKQTLAEHRPSKRNLMFIYDTTVAGPVTWYQFNDNEYLVNVQGVDDSVFPPVVGDPAAGVDTVSHKADPSAIGYHYYPVVMSPIGASNPVRTISPASDDFPVTIVGSGASTTPGALTLPDEIIGWSGTGTTSQLVWPTYNYLSYGSIFPYINSYIMKRRTLNVVVHPIGSVISGQPDDGPDMLPTQVQLEAYLNRVFEQQINVDMDVTILPQRNVAWDVATATSYTGRTFTIPAHASVPGDRRFDIRGTSPEYTAVATHSEPGDLHIYVIGGVNDMVAIVYAGTSEVGISPDNLLGYAEPTLNQAFVNGEKYTVDSVMHVIAHEVGHILVGMGHPDHNGGPAPLGLGLEESKKRLMCSGDNWNLLNPGRQLVFGEWQAAEAKLVEFD